MKIPKKIALIGAAVGVVLSSYLLNPDKGFVQTKHREKPVIASYMESLEGSINKGMPITLNRLNSYDIDKDNLFSPLEIELMGDSDAECLFEFSVMDDHIDFDSAYLALTKLSTSKLSRVLKGITNKDIKSQYFSRLADEDFKRSIEVILNIKEGHYDLTTIGEGANAGHLLNGLNSDMKERILTSVKDIDHGYHSNLLTYDKRINTWSKDSGDFPEVVPSTTKPIPIINDKREFSLDNPYAIDVIQSEYAITRSTDKKSVLKSEGAGPCVIVTLYDHENKIGAMAHVDYPIDLYPSFDQILGEFNALNGKNNYPIEARVIGGAEGFSDILVYLIEDRLKEEKNVLVVERDILHYFNIWTFVKNRIGDTEGLSEIIGSLVEDRLKEKENVLIVEKDILHDPNNWTCANIQLDTETGNVTNYSPIYELRISPEQEEKLINPRRVTRLDRHIDSVTSF